MSTSGGRRRPNRGPRAWSFLLVALGLGAQAGCGREFFREWANQDASEAVFEKSRDPRWRFDMFSVEPPAVSRFSDPYDPDRPPAPPDDYATEALSPVPQWPDNRLLVPAEGTGYLDMLEAWRRNQPYRPPAAPPVPPAAAPGTPPTPPGGDTRSPFGPTTPGMPGAGTNSGPDAGPLTPIPVPGTNPEVPNATEPAPAGPGAGPGGGQTRNSGRDAGVKIAAFQETGLPMPVPAPAAQPLVAPAGPSRDLPTPPIGMDPDPSNRDLTVPTNPRPDLSPDQYRASEAMASELSGILVPGAIDFNEAEAAGLPRDFMPYVVTMDQAFTLALINARIYQFQVEQVYIAALTVSLQRFAFTPQVYAGFSPLTGVPYPNGGFPGTIPGNVFNYSTRATGTQVSTLSLGTVAGVGKLFSSGGRLLAGFANQLVFNFVGKNSFQPRVQSFLPMSFVQPFLRGGGRAVTLEALTQAERSLLYAIRSFAKFRQEFTVATLIGGSVQNFGSAVPSLGFTGVASNDPTIGFINIVEDVQLVENNRQNIAAYERLKTVYQELIQGESSGLSQLQLDQVDSQLQGARQGLVVSRTQYRYDLDQFKQQMGLPPDTPLVPDRGLTRRFHDVYIAIEDWQRNPNRRLEDLPKYAERLPNLREQDVVLDGRSVLGIYQGGRSEVSEDALEDLLLAAERIAMEHRLDLMNQRATLYDAWRQIKVSANALQGIFNVTVTNQFVTPPNNTNPFGFVDQAKQFSLVLNAELPLVRVAERNTFRQNLIAYQRQRRSLQNTEDTIKTIVRQDVRLVHLNYLTYEIAKRNFVLTIRQKDQAFEQIIAPPAAAGATNQAALQTTNLIQFQNQLLQLKNQLVTSWYQYQVSRLQLYRDLGTLPIDEWEAFSELFPDQPVAGSAVGAAPAPDARPAGTPTARLRPAAGAVVR